MIDFKEEIAKFKPIVGVGDIEKSIQKDDVKDMMELLQYIANQIKATGKE